MCKCTGRQWDDDAKDFIGPKCRTCNGKGKIDWKLEGEKELPRHAAEALISKTLCVAADSYQEYTNMMEERGLRPRSRRRMMRIRVKAIRAGKANPWPGQLARKEKT